MFSTHLVPNADTHARPQLGPPPTDARGSNPPYSDSDGPPTIRVPVERPTAHSPLPGAPGLVATPPPVAELGFSCSVWSAGADGIPLPHRYPKVGDSLLGFKLVGELGRGAFARVFLAEQETLAGRHVALKVALRPTREAERLARLQHTNVVPVYSVHNEKALQIICMPFLGKVTLADLVRAFRTEHPSRVSGRKSTSARAAKTTAFDSKNKPSKTADSKGNTGAQRPPIWSWDTVEPPPIVGDPRAVLEVFAQLADGLAHAHARGILHLDLKPANVLLADTGEPMLFDFNLSFDAANPDREMVGGTMPYMAIEQLLDMRPRKKGEVRGKSAIDARTDLFALGVMIYELLTGTVPFPTAANDMRDIDAQIAARRAGPQPLRSRNPDVTPAVEAIVLKLLAPDPADRYQSADDVREDIQRQLNDLPLKFAREPSRRERFAKWCRRNPRLPMRLAALGLLLVALGAGAYAYERAEGKARAEEETARLAAVKRTEILRAELAAVRLDLILPDNPKARARGEKRATEALAKYGLPGATDWRNQLDVTRLSDSERAALAGDLGELLVLLARAKWHAVEAKPEPQRREPAAEVWALLAAARGCFADGAVPAAVDTFAALVAPVAGEKFEAPKPDEKREADPRELFLDGALALQQGRYAGAARLFDRVVTAKPDHGAAQFCLAYCRQQAGEFQSVLERYEVAKPWLANDPRAPFQRGLIFHTIKKPEKAEAEFTKVLALDPDHADAYRYRALARLRLALLNPNDKSARLAEAETDLTAALERGATPLHVYLFRGYVRDLRGDKKGAEADRTATKDFALKTDADFVARGWTRIDKDPKGARDDFKKALELNPRSLHALQNLAHVLAEKLKDNDGALAITSKVVEFYPEFGPAVAGHAVVLARLGRTDEAHKEIAKARQLSADPEVTYQAASVYALTGVKDEAGKPKALAVLRQALNEGHDARILATDPDFDSLRKDADFLDIQRAALTLRK